MNSLSINGGLRRHALLVLGQSSSRQISEAALCTIREFLCSNLGGAWEPNEVTLFSNCSAGEIREKIKSMKAIDYALVVFKGQGEAVKQGRPWKEMKLTSPAGDIVTERELNPGSPRCLQVFDCAENSLEPVPSFARTDHLPSTRNEFDVAILRAESGLAKVQIVASAEASLFSVTAGLIKAAAAWAAGHEGILSISEALTLARPKDDATNAVVYSGERRQFHYPFAANREL